MSPDRNIEAVLVAKDAPVQRVDLKLLLKI